jgi:hypothetical protein
MPNRFPTVSLRVCSMQFTLSLFLTWPALTSSPFVTTLVQPELLKRFSLTANSAGFRGQDFHVK